MRASRQLGGPSPVKPEVRDEGKPETFIAGVAGGVKKRGDSEIHSNQQR